MRELLRRLTGKLRYPVTVEQAVHVRPRFGECPGCGAHEREWCKDDCSLIDTMDYR